MHTVEYTDRDRCATEVGRHFVERSPYEHAARLRTLVVIRGQHPLKFVA
jgi:hypothetical protein